MWNSAFAKRINKMVMNVTRRTQYQKPNFSKIQEKGWTFVKKTKILKCWRIQKMWISALAKRIKNVPVQQKATKDDEAKSLEVAKP